MKVRANVHFQSRFPDDSVEDDEELVVWPGRNISEVLKAALERLGYRVSEPIHAPEQGWELDIWQGRRRLWLQVSVLDASECYLSAENMTFWLWRDRGLRTFLADLEGILKDDDRFVVDGWFSRGDSSSVLFPRPYDD